MRILKKPRLAPYAVEVDTGSSDDLLTLILRAGYALPHPSPDPETGAWFLRTAVSMGVARAIVYFRDRAVFLAFAEACGLPPPRS